MKCTWKSVFYYPKSYPKIQWHNVKLADSNRRWSTDEYTNTIFSCKEAVTDLVYVALGLYVYSVLSRLMPRKRFHLRSRYHYYFVYQFLRAFCKKVVRISISLFTFSEKGSSRSFSFIIIIVCWLNADIRLISVSSARLSIIVLHFGNLIREDL